MLKPRCGPTGPILRVALSAVVAAAVAVSLGLVLRGQPSAFAATSAVAWPTIGLVPLITGVTEPVFVTHAADGSGRIFIVERAGTIRIVKNGVLLTAPFLNIAARVDSESFGERGLLSMAFPPNYGVRQHFYVYYTDLAGDLVISRFGLTGNPDIADGTSEQKILTIAHPNVNHNGGQLQFGPSDGYLYLATGDGGSAGDPDNNAQNPAQLLGKVLRLDVESGNPITYTTPSSNPFTQTVGYRPEIWALGLRNPWRFSFDRQTHDLYIGDVGQNKYEEVDFQPAGSAGGQNYGWRILEGFHCYGPSTHCIAPSGYVSPVAEYDHTTGDCAIAGGYVYRGAAYVSLQGIYFYGDNCTGRIRALVNDGVGWQNTLLMQTPYSISSFGEDEAGNLYLADLGGAVYQMIGLEKKVFLPVMVR